MKNNNRTHDANEENHKKYYTDVKDILKDVEVCLKQGLERKIGSFFDDYTMFQQTHNEVLNLSIVKKMLHVNSSECEHREHNEHAEHYKRSETMYHDSVVSLYETEIETLKKENYHLSVELERYKKYLDFCVHKDQDEEQEELLSQPINLEITEKHSELRDNDTDNSSILQIQIEKNIKNIVLNSANKDIVEEEEEDTEEEYTEEEEEEDTEEEEEEEEEEEKEEEKEEQEKRKRKKKKKNEKTNDVMRLPGNPAMVKRL
jgi:hypothetical protein